MFQVCHIRGGLEHTLPSALKCRAGAIVACMFVCGCFSFLSFRINFRDIPVVTLNIRF